MENFDNKLFCILLILLIITVQSVAINVYAAGNDDGDDKEIGAWGGLMTTVKTLTTKMILTFTMLQKRL